MERPSLQSELIKRFITSLTVANALLLPTYQFLIFGFHLYNLNLVALLVLRSRATFNLTKWIEQLLLFHFNSTADKL